MSSPPSPYAGVRGRHRGDLGALLRLPRLRRLLAVRWMSQAADGVFQAGLAWLVLLSPERQQSPAAIAGAAALVLLPFSLVGPFAGVLLDRWPRRSVLVVGQSVRVVLVLALAAVGDEAGLPVVYALAIAALGMNRFLLAAFSAALPSVVPTRLLLPANALAPTVGTAWVVAGFGAGSLLLRVSGVREGGAGSPDSGVVLLTAALVMLTAAGLALRIRRDALGPAHVATTSTLAALGTAPAGMVAGLAHLVQRPQAARALLTIGASRFFFGLWTVQTALLVLDHDAGGGLSATAVVAACGASGYVSAAVVTPVARRLLTDSAWVAAVLAGSAVVTLVAAASPGIAALAVAAALLGLGAQSVKICVDTEVQCAVDEDFLGRAFATYDVVFNVAFVSAAVAAMALPTVEASPAATSVIVAAGFAVTAVAQAATARPRREAGR